MELLYNDRTKEWEPAPEHLVQIFFESKAAADKCIENLRKLNRYRWHDLRKNPDDLPEMEGYFNVYLWLKPNDTWEIEEKYIYSTQYFYGKFKNSSLWDVIAWREIEPFESGE